MTGLLLLLLLLLPLLEGEIGLFFEGVLCVGSAKSVGVRATSEAVAAGLASLWVGVGVGVGVGVVVRVGGGLAKRERSPE